MFEIHLGNTIRRYKLETTRYKFAINVQDTIFFYPNLGKLCHTLAYGLFRAEIIQNQWLWPRSCSRFKNLGSAYIQTRAYAKELVLESIFPFFLYKFVYSILSTQVPKNHIKPNKTIFYKANYPLFIAHLLHSKKYQN